MRTIVNPIAVTSVLSVLLHGIVFAALLILYSQTMSDNAVGQGVEVELISSVKVSNHHETDTSRKQQSTDQANEATNEIAIVSKRQIAPKQHIVPKNNEKKKSSGDLPVLASLSTVKNTIVQNDGREKYEQARHRQAVAEDDHVTTVAHSTPASEQKHSILELLHSRIADNKRYPYMAKRQRREGVTTVSFVLHPSGMIENMHLTNSSRTTALDRAALSAVEGIEPFIPAQDYLKQAETFKVDVVFKLL